MLDTCYVLNKQQLLYLSFKKYAFIDFQEAGGILVSKYFGSYLFKCLFLQDNQQVFPSAGISHKCRMQFLCLFSIPHFNIRHPLHYPHGTLKSNCQYTQSLPRTEVCQSPQARDFGSLAALKDLNLNKQGTFLEGFKVTLYKLQLEASHKLYITLASAAIFLLGLLTSLWDYTSLFFSGHIDFFSSVISTHFIFISQIWTQGGLQLGVYKASGQEHKKAT